MLSLTIFAAADAVGQAAEPPFVRRPDQQVPGGPVGIELVARRKPTNAR